MWSFVRRCVVVGAMLLPGAAVVHVATASPAVAAVSDTNAFVQLPPTRIVDTRSAFGGPKGPVAPGTTFNVQVTGAASIPAGASAVALNLTVDNAKQPGYLAIGPQGTTPLVSNLNPTAAGQTVANMVIVSLSASGGLTVLVQAGGQVLIDVAGYWIPAAAATAGRYTAITPVRVTDTRSGPKPARGSVVTASVAGSNGVPPDASAVAVTITAADATGAGFITAWASGQPQPDASNVNLPGAGATVPNLAIVPVGAGGKISVFTSAGAHILVDIAGWFTGASAASGTDGLFVPVSPVRVADSRSGSGLRLLGAGLSAEVSVPITAPAGLTASAVALNLTVTGVYDDGYLTASPARVPVPNASNLNYTRDNDVAGLSIVRLGSNGAINVQSYSATHLIADLAGWFTGSPAADGGYRPAKCENLMSFRHGSGDATTLKIRDRSSTIPDISFATAAFGRIGLRCERVFLSRVNADRTLNLSWTDVLGTQPERPIISNFRFDAIQPSPDGRTIFALSGGTDTTFGTKMVSIEVATGKVTLLFDAKQNVFYDISDVSADGNTLDVIAESQVANTLAWFTFDIAKRTFVERSSASTFVTGVEHSAGGTYQASTTYDRTNKIDSIGVGNGGSVSSSLASRANVYRARFTPQDELVESATRGPISISSYPFAATTVLLDGENDWNPNFPKFALR
jgi:hypothetical protein